jgi:hypothetical protein
MTGVSHLWNQEPAGRRRYDERRSNESHGGKFENVNITKPRYLANGFFRPCPNFRPTLLGGFRNLRPGSGRKDAFLSS